MMKFDKKIIKKHFKLFNRKLIPKLKPQKIRLKHFFSKLNINISESKVGTLKIVQVQPSR